MTKTQQANRLYAQSKKIEGVLACNYLDKEEREQSEGELQEVNRLKDALYLNW